MVRMTLMDLVRRSALVMVCAPLVLLAGCPQDQAAAPGKVPAQATAPPIATSAASAKAGQAPQPGTTQPGTTTTQPADNAKVQQLINRAEQTYRSGRRQLSRRHLDAARVDFDTAVDLMLTSGMDLKADPQLADEFDHLLNAVNSLEMAALKQGNGFSPSSKPLRSTPPTRSPSLRTRLSPLRSRLS